MQADLIMTIALLKKLELLTKKEAEDLYEELKYSNLSMEYKDCLTLVENAFKKNHIKGKVSSTLLTIDGKDVKVTK